MRSPRPGIAPADRSGVVIVGIVGLVAVAAAIFLLDDRTLALAGGLSPRTHEFFQRLTVYGKSSGFLWSIGIVMLVLAWLDVPVAPRFSRLVLAAWAVRLGFVFTAIAAPGIFVVILKGGIGRARPLIQGPEAGTYQTGEWTQQASFPSGHATTAFAALVAIGALVPQARALLWIYAILIAVSRVALATHYPSDVIGGAIVGSITALLVRNWFAERQLGFTVRPDGRVRPLPGPSFRRILGAIARSLRAVARPAP